MKLNTLIIVAAAVCLPSCATIHEMSAPRTVSSSKTIKNKKTNQYAKLADQTSAWLGETVTIESVDKGVFSTDFIAVTRKGKKISCFYGGYFGWKISSIVCGGRGNPLLNTAG